MIQILDNALELLDNLEEKIFESSFNEMNEIYLEKIQEIKEQIFLASSPLYGKRNNF